MKLLTKAIEKKLPSLNKQSKLGMESIAYVKFFTPDSSWTWYVTGYDPKTKTFFGLVQGLETEFGCFTLDELESVRGHLGLPIERDLFFDPIKLSDIK